MNLDGSDERRLTDFGVMSWAPYFHPSGKYLIFTANKLGFGNFELYIVDAEGRHEPVRVTFTDGFDGLPVFSPDGTKLAWTSGRTPDGKSQIFLADWNHEAALRALDESPARQLPGASPPSSTSSSANSADLFTPGFTTNYFHAVVSYLASEELEGRLAGSTGEHKAGDFIAAQMTRIGLIPVGTNDSLFQSYDFSAEAKVLTNENQLRIRQRGAAAMDFEVNRDFRPLAFTANADIEAEPVFVGYGLTVPGQEGHGYDSYAGVDVSNRIAVVLRYVPEGVDAKRRAELNQYSGVRYKAMQARDHGAKGVLFVTGPNSPNAGELIGLSSDNSLSGSGIVAASVSSNVAAALFAGSGFDLQTLQTGLDQENPHAQASLVLTNVQLRLQTGVAHIRKPDRNVMGLLPSGVEASGPSSFLMIGAHYDHLGRGEVGSLSHKGEEGKIHPGADDNASGVAAVLEIAGALAAERARHPAAFPRGIIFAAWSGEEIGLIGSSWFAEHPPLPLTNVAAYLNFDMVGRLRQNKLSLQGVGSSPAWARMIEKRNVAAGFNLSLEEDPYLPTDTTSLYPKGVPVLAFFTGSHEDYHRPTDTADTVNYDGAVRVAKFARGILTELESSERPAYAEVQLRHSASGGRENLRAYLGTIPDYATEVQGVKLSGVRAGGPADKAGLKGGDVIVEFGGAKVANVYDYTYALDAVKIGQPTDVVILRNGERLSLKVTPEARK